MVSPGDVHRANSQLQRARELLGKGQPQEALILALDALQAVLHHLRASLLNLQRNLAQAQEEKAEVNLTQAELEALASLLQGKKSPWYH